MTTFDTLRLDTLVTSPTNPRKNFHAGRLQELADSIAASGVHQPILVRPLPAQRLADTAFLKPRPTHEVVAGERRYRASKMAGMVSVPAMIRDLTDDQVLEIQIVENIQRDSLTELETAEGYKTLMEHNGLTAEQVGQKVSKSRSSVYGSLKLLDLHPFAKQYLRDETIGASAALLIARISDVLLQQKAAIQAAKSDAEGHKPSIRTFQAWLRDNVMLDLEKASFPTNIKIAGVCAGSCKDCTKRTGHDPDLFADVKTDMCTNPPCYHIKVQAHKDALAAQMAAIRQTSNRNVDEQHDLGLVSTLAQDARAESKAITEAALLKHNITTIRNGKDLKIAHRSRHAIFDKLKDHIKATKDGECCELLGSDVLRNWLARVVDWHDEECIGAILDMGFPDDGSSDMAELNKQAVMRVQAASRADIYRYTALAILIEDRDTIESRSDEPPLLLNAFAADHGIDIDAVREETAEDVEDEMQSKITAINKQIKATKAESAAPKTTSTQPPAGAAIGTGEADAKKPKPAGASRKAKTTAQEAKAGIAAAMQGMEAEPLDAALGGSGTAAIPESNGVKEGPMVEVQFGRHFGKIGTVTNIVGDNMFDVTIGSGPKATQARLSGQQFKKVIA